MTDLIAEAIENVISQRADARACGDYPEAARLSKELDKLWTRKRAAAAAATSGDPAEIRRRARIEAELARSAEQP